MRRTSDKHKKWMLHIQNQWPNQHASSDPLVCSWFEDRMLCAFEWQTQSMSSDILLSRQRDAEPYLDYLKSSNLTALLGDGVSWLLLDAEGFVMGLDSSEAMRSQLCELGIEAGFSFSKALIGTTAFSLAKKANALALMQRHEAYKKALHDFAAVCAPVRNHTGGFFLMVMLDKHVENALAKAQVQVERLTSHESKNLRNVTLFESVLDAMPDMVCVFGLDGAVQYLNRTARNLVRHGMVFVNGFAAFSLHAFFGEALSETLNASSPQSRISVDIQRRHTNGICICFAKITVKSLRDISWRRTVMKQILGKDGYINKVLAQRGNGGLRMLISTEVGSGEHYLVNYIASQLPDKELNTLDCLAGFTQHGICDIIKSRFLRHLLNANGHILCLENIELLAPDLQSLLLNVLSSCVITDENGQHQVFSVDLIACASPEFDWSSSHLGRLLYLKLSMAQLDLKPLSADKSRLQATLLLMLEKLSAQENVVLTMDDKAREVLLEYHWPGNFLEAFQVIENAVARCEQGVIAAKDLPERMKIKNSKEFGATNFADAERSIIANAWREHHGQVANVAKALGLSRTTLWRKMKKLNLNRQSLTECV
ncbi:UNVERIFIED_CONTAM: hypothetical protein I5919_18965 [Aeromonas hydrophila]